MTYIKSEGKVWTCDGTDDDIQIQLALDSLAASGETVYFSPGSFHMDDITKLTGCLVPSGTVLQGAGMYDTIFEDDRGATANLVGFFTNEHYGLVTRDSNIVMRDFTIDGNRATTQGFGAYFDNIDDVELENVFIKDSYHDGIAFNTLNTRGSFAQGGGNTYASHVQLKGIRGSGCGVDTIGISAMNLGTGNSDISITGLDSYNHGAGNGTPSTGAGISASVVDILNLQDIKINHGGEHADGIRFYGVTHANMNTIDVRGMTGAGSTAGTCTSDGSVGGTTTIDTSRTEANDTWNTHIIAYLTGLNVGTSQTISDYDLATHTITHGAFANQTKTGDTYIIVTPSRGIRIAETSGGVHSNDIQGTNIIAIGSAASNIYVNHADNVTLDVVTANDSVGRDGIELINGSTYVTIGNATLKHNLVYSMRSSVAVQSYLLGAKIHGNGTDAPLNVTVEDNEVIY